MTTTNAEEVNAPRKLKNGMIAIIDGEISTTSKKWLDIEITNYFPVISVGGSAVLHQPGMPIRLLNGVDHLSIPSDLRVHITGRNERTYFDVTQSWALAGGQRDGLVHLFSVAGVATSRAPYLSGGKRREWDEVALLSPFLDSAFDPTRTRAVFDFVIHNDPALRSTVTEMPGAFPGWRPAYDRHGCTFGPFWYRGLQRRHRGDSTLLFTLRMGWVEFEDLSPAHVYVPAAIFEYPPRVAK